MKYLSIIILINFGISFSQVTVTTDDGKKVLLNSDGTWEYVVDKKANSSNDDVFKVRGVAFGSSQDVAISSEKLEIIESQSDEDNKWFMGKILGLDGAVGYRYTKDDELFIVKFIFLEKHTNKNSYLSDYKSINGKFVSKYGTPSEDKAIWLNDLYKDDYSDWGMALSIGHLTKYSKWVLDNGNTTIMQMLSGDNYKISHAIEYLTEPWYGKFMKQTEDASLDEF